MKIKKQFEILSFLIFSIPILCSVFVVIHTYIHSPNRYLIKGSASLGKEELPSLSDKDINNLKISLQMLPQDVQAVLMRTSDRKIIYSTIPEFHTDVYVERDELWNFATETSDKYFYQFSKIPSTGRDTLLVTRLPLHRINNAKKTKNYLKVLFVVIVITITSLIQLFFISRAILNDVKSSIK